MLSACNLLPGTVPPKLTASRIGILPLGRCDLCVSPVWRNGRASGTSRLSYTSICIRLWAIYSWLDVDTSSPYEHTQRVARVLRALLH